MRNRINKNKLIAMLLCFLMALGYTTVISFADESDSKSSVGVINEKLEKGPEKTNKVDSDKTDKFIDNYFGSDIFSDVNLSSGYQIATPFAGLILTLTLALVIVLMYAFFGQTAIDLLYLTVPATRGFFNDRKEKSGGFGATSGGKSKGGFFQISDSAMEAVGGGSNGGGLGGGQERGVGSSLLKYFGLRTAEMITFVLFIIFVFTGMIGQIIKVIFHLFMSLFEGFLNMA